MNLCKFAHGFLTVVICADLLLAESGLSVLILLALLTWGGLAFVVLTEMITRAPQGDDKWN